MIYTEQQERAIDNIVAWYGEPNKQEYYLAGYAGVGKSTIAHAAIERIKYKYNISNVKTAAYTGKAASVLRKKGVTNAQTIHSLIYIVVEDALTGDVSFVLSEISDAAHAELIALDECSMVSEQIANDLRSFGRKILVMGDPGQLPPVNGQGSFTNREPDTFLHEIHRQAADSPILELATMARQGIPLPRNYHKGNVRVIPLSKSSSDAIYADNTQVLCGLNRVRWTITQLMRKELLYSGEVPEVGEKIICCKNDNKIGLFNGGLGILKNINVKGDHFQIDADMEDLRLYHDLDVDPYLFERHFDNGTAQRIPKRRYQEFDWGYCLSTHKAQGSSWDHVTIIDDSAAFHEDSSKWLYTSLTRAETGLTLLLR